MNDTTTTRRRASEFDNTKFNRSTTMTDAEYAGYIRGMFDCGCEHCFGRLLYEETALFLTEDENEQLYKFQLNDWQIQSEVRVENAQRFERDELIAILIERTKRLHR